MATVSSVEVEYPESDGKPMGETDLHRRWMVDIIDMLSWHFRDQRTYVSGDLLVYLEEGNTSRFFVPDAFFIKKRKKGDRRVFKIWEEGVPNAVFETTSRKTKKKDTHDKYELCEQLGVKEYILYDPTGDYLRPRLKAYRLSSRGKYQPIPPDAEGFLPLKEAGWRVALDEAGGLVVRDAKTGEPVLPARERSRVHQERAEVERQRAQAERERAQAERERADHEAAARQKLEAELAQLKAEMKRGRRNASS